MRGAARRGKKYEAKLTGRTIPGQAAHFGIEIGAQVEAEEHVKSLNPPAIYQNYYMIFAKEIKSILKKHKGDIAQTEACIAWQRWQSRGLDSNTLNNIVEHYGLQPCVPVVPCEDWVTQEECEAAGCYWYDDACHSEPPPVCDWSWKRKLTFSGNVSGTNLDYFPILVHLTVANFDFNKAQNLGEDIRFMDSDTCPTDGTPLKHEIELWDKPGLNAWVWVKVPRINGGTVNDFIYMFYGNGVAADGQDAQNVWTENYKAVWHLRNVNDSTANVYHVAKKGPGEPADASAKIDGGQLFDGVDDYLEGNPVAVMMDNITDGTLIFWLHYPSTPAASKYILDVSGPVEQANREFILLLVTDQLQFIHHGGAAWGGSILTSTIACTPGAWNHCCVTWGANGVRWYIDGAPDGFNADTSATTGAHTKMKHGRHHSLGAGPLQRYDGYMDEFRVCSAQRTADWIMAQFKSQDETLITFGAEEPA